MFAFPEYKLCLDENGNYSEEKFNDELTKIINICKNVKKTKIKLSESKHKIKWPKSEKYFDSKGNFMRNEFIKLFKELNNGDCDFIQ